MYVIKKGGIGANIELNAEIFLTREPPKCNIFYSHNAMLKSALLCKCSVEIQMLLTNIVKNEVTPF